MQSEAFELVSRVCVCVCFLYPLLGISILFLPKDEWRNSERRQDNHVSDVKLYPRGGDNFKQGVASFKPPQFPIK